MKKFFEILLALAASLVVDETPDRLFISTDGFEMPVEACC